MFATTKQSLPTVPIEAFSRTTAQIYNDSAVHDLRASKDHISCLSVENSNSSGSNFLYGKLNHPTEKLIGTLPNTDEFDLEKLITFLKVALNLCKMYPDIKRNILSVLLPYAQGPLNSC